MADGGLELDTDYLLVSAAVQCASAFGGYMGLLRPLSSTESPDVRRVMDIAKGISLGGFVLSITAVALTINGSFVVDRPIQTTSLGFLVTGGCLIALHIALHSLFNATLQNQHEVEHQLKDIYQGSVRRDSVSGETNTLSPRGQRLTFCLAIIALCVRVELFRQTLGYRQCTAPGIEGLLPLLLAIREYRSLKPYHNGDGSFQNSAKGLALLWTLLRSPIKHIGPSALIATANVLASRVSASPRSTYICPTAAGTVQYTLLLQWAGLILDFLILISVGTLLNKRRTSGPSKPGKAPFIVGSLLILSAFCISFFGAIACIIRPQYRARIRNIDGAYLGSFAWITTIFTLSMIFALRLLTTGNILDLTIIVSFICTYILGASSSWAERSAFPAGSQLMAASSLTFLFIGIVLYLRFNGGTDESSNKLPVRLFPRVPASLYALLLAMFLFRVFLDITPSVEFDIHPIDILMSEAAERHDKWLVQASASGTLTQAITEYRRRYNRQPPPNFDKWYEFATLRTSLIIDDYDGIFDDLLPFWAFDPENLRARTHEILADTWNEVAEVRIRSGKAEIGDKLPPTHRWMVEGAIAMIDNFIEWLPDMDIALNINDESRVAVPYKEITKYRKIGANAEKVEVRKKNVWSENRAATWLSSDEPVSTSSRFADHSFTNTFYNYGSISCPPLSPARREHIWDPRTLCRSCFNPHSIGPFVSNWTLSASPCHQPDLANLHGFYLSPAAFKTALEPIPVFSQSKAHGYADILYPSPWNYIQKVKYDPALGDDTDKNTHSDPPFARKQNTLFWRGATSEGVSTVGTWKGMTRQRFVHLAKNHTSTVPILLPDGSNPARYEYQFLSPKAISLHPLLNNITLDVSIVDHIVRCGDTDCPLQEAEFGLLPPSEFQEHWQYRYLMDMDGAGFSGRFLPFLKSRSLVFKTALFREWYDSRITAWRHFVPIDIRLHGLWSTLAYFAGGGKTGDETAGRIAEGESIAEQGRDWAHRVLRKEDMEIYFFRLLLEWGRLTDDRRDEIGFEM